MADPDRWIPVARPVLQRAHEVAGLGLVLWTASAPGAPVQINRSWLREELLPAHPGAVAVVAGQPGDVPVLARALAEAVQRPDQRALAGLVTLAPVVDAMKQVDADRVVRTVDRSALRRVVSPAVLRVDALLAVLDADADRHAGTRPPWPDPIRPARWLTGAGHRLGALPTTPHDAPAADPHPPPHRP